MPKIIISKITMRSAAALLVSLLAAGALAACAATPIPAAGPSAAPASPAGSNSVASTFPPNVTEFKHRGTYWYVVVALARAETDPKLAAAIRTLKDVGYRDVNAGQGVVAMPVSDCDEGLREGLQLKAGDYFHVSLAFPDPATAQRFVDAYQPGVVGTFKVITGCMD